MTNKSRKNAKKKKKYISINLLKKNHEGGAIFYLSAIFPISPPRASTSCTSCDLAGPPTAGLQGCIELFSVRTSDYGNDIHKSNSFSSLTVRVSIGKIFSIVFLVAMISTWLLSSNLNVTNTRVHVKRHKHKSPNLPSNTVNVQSEKKSFRP